MFPSNSDCNTDPIAYIDHSILQSHFPTEIIPCSKSKQEDPPLSVFHFPSPCYNHCELELEDHDVLFQQHRDLLHHQNTLVTDNSVSETVINIPDSSKIKESAIDCTRKSHNATNQQMPRKKSSSRRDRHSKINTANGPRDRRMRLSLDVAREFFGLQDMLGYDKASRTVEWLLMQANPQIKKLARSQLSQVSVAAAKSPSSTSEGDVVSGIVKAAINGSISKGKPSTKERKERQPRRYTIRPLARDMREKARARAKARTKAKTMWTQRLDESKLCDDARNNDLNEFSSWSSFGTGEEFGIQDHSRNNPSCLQFAVAEVKELSSRDREHICIHWDMVEEPLAIINRRNPNSIFNCLQNAGINQERHHTGYLSLGKPWEV